MLRSATIASLFLLNVSVWIGPTATVFSYTSPMFDPAPRIERADAYVVSGNLKAAYDEFRALVQAYPENGTFHYEYGLFCYLHADALRDTLGLSQDELRTVVRSELRLGRDLAGDGYDMAMKYALTLMDERFFADSVPREESVEAWQYFLLLVEERHSSDPNWYKYRHTTAQVLTQLARVEAGHGETEAARKYLDRARAISPEFRIPEGLIEKYAPEGADTV